MNFTQEQKKVMTTINKMTDAFHAGNIEGVMSTYEPDAVVVFEPEKPISDKSVLRNMFQEAFSINPKFEYRGHEVFIAGDVATHIAPWNMTGTAPDGTKIKDSGLSIAILKKQPDGNWLMAIDNPHGQFLMN